MLRVFELNVKNPAFGQFKIAQMQRIFFELETTRNHIIIQ